jgi:hypothetical protein
MAAHDEILRSNWHRFIVRVFFAAAYSKNIAVFLGKMLVLEMD